MMERMGETSPRGWDYRCLLSPHHTDGNIRPGFRERQPCGRRRIGKETIMSTAVMMERIAGVFYLLIADFKAARI